MNKPKGGRGKKVPYNSVTVRVPEDLKDTIDRLVSEYRQFILEGIETKNNDIPSIDETKELIKKLLKAKSSKIDTIIKLVMSIYGIEVKREDLE
jgi:hypothetical protein